MNRVLRLRQIGGAIALFTMSCVAQGATIYNNATTWAANVSGVTTINFEGIAPDGGFVNYPPGGTGTFTVVGGVTFAIGPSSPDGLLFVVGDNYYYPGVSTLSSQRPSSSGPPNDLLISLPSAVTALGFHFGDFAPSFSGVTATITLSDSTVATASSEGTVVFFGVTSSVGIISVDITDPIQGAVINLTDFSFATAAAAVPEPSSTLLIGTVLAGAIGMLRRRRRTS